eukprot:s1684_g1.t1
MDVVPATEEASNLVCRLCGNGYPESAGRVHGKAFSCWQCLNIQQTVRRNLGSTVPLNDFTPEETQSFFQKVPEKKDEKDGKVSWTTIRGQLLKVMTQRHLSRFMAKVEVEELPLSVYETRGWKKETVERFPKEWSEAYNDYIYKVPVRTMTWEEAFETVNEKILQLEKEAAQKRGKVHGGSDQGKALDLPHAGKEKKDEKNGDKKAEREAASQAKKISTGNQKIASTAANALGPLNSLETSLFKLLTKANALSQEDSASKNVCRECLEKAKIWKQHAHAAVTQHEQSKDSAELQPALTALPFDASSVKTLCKQGAEGMKELRASFPKKEAKAKAAPKAAAESDNGEGAPKRRRTKGP